MLKGTASNLVCVTITYFLALSSEFCSCLDVVNWKM